MTAGLYSITIEQGANFRLSVDWLADGVDVDLTGYHAEAVVRSESKGALLLDLNPTIVDGRIEINVPASVTAAANWRGAAKWELRVVANNGSADRLLAGQATLSPSLNV